MKKVCEVEGCAGCPMRQLFPDNEFIEPQRGTNSRLQIGDFPRGVEPGVVDDPGASFGGWVKNFYFKGGLSEADNYKLNVIQCHPPDGVFPTDPAARSYIGDGPALAAVNHCKQAHVEPFLKSRPWTRIDTFGEKPLKYLLEKSAGLDRWRGSILPVPILGNADIAIPTYGPEYVAKVQAIFPIVVNDLRKTLVKDPEYYNIFPSLEDVRRFTAKKFAFDIETSGWTKEISMVGFSADDYHAIVVPFIGEYVDEIRRIFAEAEEVVGQNCIQFDLPVLAHNGITIRKPKDCRVWDIMLLHHLRFPTFPHDLEFIGKQFTNKGAWKYDKVQYQTYCARDVDVTWRAFEPLRQLVQSAGLMDVYQYVSWPLAKICKLMTDTGIRRSTSRLKTLREELFANIAKAELDLPDELKPIKIPRKKRVPAPEGTLSEKGNPVKFIYEQGFKVLVPWRSSDVKKKYLYETLGLPVQRNIKTGKITSDKNALDKLYVRHKLPVLKTLKDLNKWATLLSGFAKDTEVKDDEVHPSFNPHGTETGRLSSSNPNIQNQPSAARFTYVPRNPNGRICSVDFSGIENRLVAYLAQDRKRLAWFKDTDFSEHKHLAALKQGIPYDQVEKSKDKDSPYAIAKIIVHGCCDAETEFFNGTYWQRMDTWSEGTPVMEWSKDHSMELKRPLEYHKYSFAGNLIEGNGRFSNAVVTPNHKFAILYGNAKHTKVYRDAQASELKVDYHSLPLNGQYVFGSLDVDVRLAAAIQADACLQSGKYAVFHLVRPRKQQRLEQLLEGKVYKKTPCKCHEGGFRYNVSVEATRDCLRILTDKRFNDAIFSLTKERALQLCDEIFHWDGSVGKSSQIFLSVYKGNVERLQTLFHLCGKTALIGCNTNRKNAYGLHPIWSLSVSRWSTASFQTLKELPYEGFVYCFTTSSGYFLARREGKIFVSGNSDRMMGAKKISAQFDVDFQETKEFQAMWKREIADTIAWQQRISNAGTRNGWIANPFGRKLWVWEANSATRIVSFMPQSTAADVIYRAMIACMYERIDWPEDWARKVAPVLEPLPEGVLLLAQVHDELLTETESEELVQPTLDVLRKVMTQPWPELNGLSLPIGTGVGPSWGDC